MFTLVVNSIPEAIVSQWFGLPYWNMGADFVEEVWERQRMVGYGAVAFKDDPDEWDEYRLRVSPGQASLIDVFAARGDGEENWHGVHASYFCPNLFRQRRSKEQCQGGRWLYQDLDEARPDECPIPPDIWWATSFGRYQGLWLMSRALPPIELASLNKALNRSCGADKGTWNLTRMLRIPGTWNGNRGCWSTPAFRMSQVKPVDLVGIDLTLEHDLAA